MLSVCLSACALDYSESYERIFMKFLDGWDVGQVTVWLDFDGDPDDDPHAGILYLWLFIYCCNSYRQPRIKHESPRQRFELSAELTIGQRVVAQIDQQVWMGHMGHGSVPVTSTRDPLTRD